MSDVTCKEIKSKNITPPSSTNPFPVISSYKDIQSLQPLQCPKNTLTLSTNSSQEGKLSSSSTSRHQSCSSSSLSSNDQPKSTQPGHGLRYSYGPTPISTLILDRNRSMRTCNNLYLGNQRSAIHSDTSK